MTYSLKDYYNHLHHGKTTDKWERYLDAYDLVLAPYREREITLLEIGIQNGGSLEIWSQFFPRSRKIVGCDINPDCRTLIYSDQKIKVIVGDANDPHVIDEIRSETVVNIDIIIDDGSHTSSDIIKTFIKYFPILADEGVFIIEDLHCSYWKEFEGGLYDPMSSMAFLKKLSDAINYEHWGHAGKKVSDLFLEFGQFFDIDVTQVPFDHIYSVTFYNSVCIIHKKEKTDLGNRIIVGEQQTIVSLDNVLSRSCAAAQENNYWTGMFRSPEAEFYPNQLLIEQLKNEFHSCKQDNFILKDEISQLKNRINQLNDEIIQLKNGINELNKEMEVKEKYLNEITNSKSWKIIQKIQNLLKGSR